MAITSYTWRDYTVTDTFNSVQSTEVQLGVWGTIIPVGAGKRLVTGAPIWTRGFDNRYSHLETGVTPPGVYRPYVDELDEQANIVGTFQVAFGYHVAPEAERGVTKINRLWANGNIIYDASDPQNVRRYAALNQGGIRFVFQEGDETQISESHVTADKGSSPGNRGMIVATFIAFPSGALGFGASIPTIVAELVEDVTVTPVRTDFVPTEETEVPDDGAAWLDWNTNTYYGLREDPDNSWTLQAYNLETRSQVSGTALGGFSATHDADPIANLVDTVMVDLPNKKAYMSVNGTPNTAPIIEIDYVTSAITKVWAETSVATFPTTFQTTPGDGGSIPTPASGTVIHGISNNNQPHTGLFTGSFFSETHLVQIGAGSEGMSYIAEWDTGDDVYSVTEYPLIERPNYAAERASGQTVPGFESWYTTASGQTWAAIVTSGSKAYIQYGSFDDAGVPSFLLRHMFAHHPGYQIHFAHIDRQDDGIVLLMEPDGAGSCMAAKYDVGFQNVGNALAILGIQPTTLLDGDMSPVSLNFSGARGLIPQVSNPPIGSTVRYTWLVPIPAFTSTRALGNATKYTNSTEGNFVYRGINVLHYLNLGSGSTRTVNTAGGLLVGGAFYWLNDDNGLLYIGGDSDEPVPPYDVSVLSTSSSSSILLSDFLRWVSMRVGYEEDEIEVDAAITDTLLGVHFTKPYPIDKLLQDLGAAYDFRHFESGDKIKFVRAGTGGSFTSVASLTRADLAPISEGGADGNECVLTTFDPSGQSVGSVSITYLDPALNYAKNVQTYVSPNIVDEAGTGTTNLDLSFVIMTTSEAYNRVTQIMLNSAEQSVSQQFRLPWRHIRLEPADALTLTFNGYVYSVRLDEVTINGDKTLSCLGRNYGYAPAATVDVDDYLGGLPQVVPGGNVSRPVAIDGNLLYAEYEVALVAVLNTGIAATAQTGWTGGSFMVNYVGLGAFQVLEHKSADIPLALLAQPLADTDTPNLPDESTVITLRARSMVEDDLASLTDEQEFLSGLNTIAIGPPEGTGPWEYIYFRTAAAVDDKTFELTGLLRGRRGTEGSAGGHSVGDHVYLLKTSASTDNDVALTVRPTPATLIGEEVTWRAKGDGETPIAAFDVTATLAANSLKPWAPCHYKVELAGGNDLNVSWTRRSRLSAIDEVEDPPLGEATEEYVLEILDGAGILKRTVTGLTTPDYVYSSANQTTDGFTPPLSTLQMRAYQISAVVGRGYTKTETVDVD